MEFLKRWFSSPETSVEVAAKRKAELNGTLLSLESQRDGLIMWIEQDAHPEDAERLAALKRAIESAKNELAALEGTDS
jgi:hypothetical protein